MDIHINGFGASVAALVATGIAFVIVAGGSFWAFALVTQFIYDWVVPKFITSVQVHWYWIRFLYYQRDFKQYMKDRAIWKGDTETEPPGI